ncbi:MAG: PIN domain-containing protein [Dehalococcoidia bacterium]|nr:MAG: PIN domain-containing protein [Dehalococcoidia bacterium]
MSSTRSRVVPHLYVDTPILIDVLRDRRTASLKLLEDARRRMWRVSTSQFAVMELLDTEQDDKFFIFEVGKGRTVASVLRERYRRKLPEDARRLIEKRVKDFLEVRYPFIQYFQLTGEGFNRAIGLCANTNISAPDCLHLATALEARCDILITTDEHFLEEAKDYIEVCQPENVQDTLNKLGFQAR